MLTACECQENFAQIQTHYQRCCNSALALHSFILVSHATQKSQFVHQTPVPIAVHGALAVVYDMNGREATDAEPVVEALPEIEQYIFCSSAGVYLKSDQMPHREEDATDQKSRHKVPEHYLKNSARLAHAMMPRRTLTKASIQCMHASERHKLDHSIIACHLVVKGAAVNISVFDGSAAPCIICS